MPPKKPVEAQSRHNTKEEIEKKKLAEESAWVGDELLDNLSAQLIDENAVETWHRLVKEFRKKRLAGNLDYDNLLSYCNAVARELAIFNKIKHEFSKVAEDDLEEKAAIVKDNESELKTITDTRLKLANTLGLTVQSRLQSGDNAVNTKEEGIKEDFGGI